MTTINSDKDTTSIKTFWSSLNIPLSAAAFGYFFLLSLAYQWGYWRGFNIHILEFATFEDVIKLASYSLLGGFILIIISLFGIPHQKSGKIRNDIFHELLQRYKALNFIAHILVFALVYTLLHYENYPMNIRQASMVIGAYFTGLLIYNDQLSSLIPNTRLRSVLIFGFLIAFPMLYVHGATKAIYIIEELEYDYTLPKFLPLSVEESASIGKLKYLGKTSNYIFFLSQDNQRVIIFSNDKIDKLILFHFMRPGLFRYIRADRDAPLTTAKKNETSSSTVQSTPAPPPTSPGNPPPPPRGGE